MLLNGADVLTRTGTAARAELLNRLQQIEDGKNAVPILQGKYLFKLEGTQTEIDISAFVERIPDDELSQKDKTVAYLVKGQMVRLNDAGRAVLEAERRSQP